MADEKLGYSEAETAKRRDETIRHMLNTPPQPRVKGASKETDYERSAKPANPTSKRSRPGSNRP